ncbi:hypothetical protein FQN51_000015 [Onygenales sp. PD_10]|nr:hypothetical protein FQN51_000015 [Onygenales sp. PD_10]
MADAPKKRGRPRKLDATGAPIVKPQPYTGPPRKRGRPRKEPATDAPEPAETAPKRPRGRPRKSDIGEAPSSKKPRLAKEAVAATAAAAATPATKSKRGRPRKSDVADTDDTAAATPATKSKRGRPRKSDVADIAATAAATPATKSKRGRPRKSDVADTAATAAATPATKSKRGRPRKSDVADIAATAAATPATKSKRGRPRKSDVAAPELAPAETAVNGSKVAGLTLDRIIGTYSLECKEVEDNWPDQAEDMEVTITKSSGGSLGLIGGFNMGILEGTMLLAADKKSLEKFRDVMSKEDSSEIDGEGETSDDGGVVPRTGTKSAPVKDRRVYFSWRGQNTGDTEIHCEVKPGTQDGHIEFTSDEAITFKGVAGFPALGQECEFKGTKIDNDVTAAPPSWSSFSQEAANAANVNRWR